MLPSFPGINFLNPPMHEGLTELVIPGNPALQSKVSQVGVTEQPSVMSAKLLYHYLTSGFPV
jgi:hypothetical protein